MSEDPEGLPLPECQRLEKSLTDEGSDLVPAVHQDPDKVGMCQFLRMLQMRLLDVKYPP